MPSAIQLAAALDDWAHYKGRPGGDRTRKRLLALARAADPDARRNKLRDALEQTDQNAAREQLLEAAASIQIADWPPNTLHFLGVSLKNLGAVEQAVTLLQQAQRQYPENFWICTALAECLRELEPPLMDEAIRFGTAAVALRPQSSGAHANLGSDLDAKGRPDEAIDECKTAIRLKPEYAVAHASLANALRHKGQLDEAIAEYREAIRLITDEALFHFNLGIALRDKGQLDEAIAAFREAIRLKRDYPDAHYNLGNVLRDKGELDEAIAAFRAAIRLKKDFAKAHNNLGTVLKDKGRIDEAIAEYRAALCLIRMAKEAAIVHHNLGTALSHKGLVDEAIAEFREAVRLDPNCAEAHNGLGVRLRDKGLLEDALAEYREAIRINPKLAKAHIDLGAFLCDVKRDYDGAIRAFKQAIRLKPNDVDAHNNLGNALSRKGLIEDAIAEYQEAIRLKPDFAEAHYGLGNMFREKGQFDDVITQYHNAIRIKPDHLKAHVNLGAVLCDVKRDYVGAIAAFQEAIRINPGSVLAQHNLGVALRNRGQLDEAIACFREAIRLKPDYAEARSNLRRAERLSELDHKLPAILSGKQQPADVVERIALADLCQQPYKKRYTVALRFYEEAFAAEPKLNGAQPSEARYNAACAAAQAGCGQDVDAVNLDIDERARLRQKALAWLKADLAAWHKVLEKDESKAAPTVRQQMQHWLTDTDFAGVQRPDALAKLPETERQEWQNVWTEVEALRRRAVYPAKRAANGEPAQQTTRNRDDRVRVKKRSRR